MNVIGNIIASIGADIKPMINALAESQEAMEKWKQSTEGKISKFNEGIEKAGKTVKKVGQKMSLYVTSVISGIGIGAFKMHKDFESSMSKIVGLVGISQNQVDSWGEDILKLAPQIGVGAREMAEGLFFVTSAGLRGAQAFDTLTIAAKASVAGLGETKVVADMITSVMNAYGVENMSAAKAADILTAAVREGKLEADALAPVMGRIIPTASAMGVAFEQVAGVLAVMSRTGVPAEQAVTNLNAIMSSFIKPTEQAKKTLFDEIGMSFEDLQGQLAQQPDGIIQVLKKLDTAFEGNTEKLAQIIPNLEAFRGVMNVLAQDTVVVDEVMRGVANAAGSFDKAFQSASNTTENKWQKALTASSTALTALGKTVSEMFVPILERVTGILSGVTNWFQSLSEDGKKMVIVIGAIVAAIGPLLTVIGFFMTSVIPGLLTALPTIIGFLTGPIGIAVALGVVAGGFLLFSKKTDSASESIKKFDEKMNQVIDLTTRVEPLLSRYDELQTKLATNTKLSSDEQQELSDIIKTIAGDMPSAVNGFDEYGNAISISTDRVREYIQGQQLLLQYQNKDAIEKTKKDLEKVSEEFELLKKQREEITATGGFTQFMGAYAPIPALTKSTSHTYQETKPERVNQLIQDYDEMYAYVTGAQQELDRLTGAAIEKEIERRKQAKKAAEAEAAEAAEAAKKAAEAEAKKAAAAKKAAEEAAAKKLANYKTLTGLDELLAEHKKNLGEANNVADRRYYNEQINRISKLIEIEQERASVGIGDIEKMSTVATQHIGHILELEKEKTELMNAMLVATDEKERETYAHRINYLKELIAKLKSETTNLLSNKKLLPVQVEDTNNKSKATSSTEDPFVTQMKMRTEASDAYTANHEKNLEQMAKWEDNLGSSTIDIFEEIGKQMATSLSQGQATASGLIKSALATATGYLIQWIMLEIPFPANIAVAMGAGALMAGISSVIPEFASGALVYGPTVGLMGEYAGASNNPEVIAPLDKLKELLSLDKNDMKVHGVIAGDAIYITNERYGRTKRLIE